MLQKGKKKNASSTVQIYQYRVGQPPQSTPVALGSGRNRGPLGLCCQVTDTRCSNQYLTGVG